MSQVSARMKAVVVPAPGTWSLEEVPVPQPGPGELLVAVKAAGICGTDLHILAGHFPPAPYPLIPGHEFAGIVAGAGPGVTGVAVGDRVAIDPSLFCGQCRYCQSGRGNLCARWGAIGDTVNGAFAEYVVAPATTAHSLPPGLSFAAGALVEPTSCVVHGLHRLALRPGSDLLIMGAGTIGLLLLQAARQSGGTLTDMVDTDEARRGQARSFGADHVAASASQLVTQRGRGYEYVIDATGAPDAVQSGLAALDRGGSLLIFGVAPEDGQVSLSPFTVYNHEHTILGSMAVLNSFGPALALLSAGVIDPDRMVTHQFGLAEFGAALTAMRERRGLKVQLTFD